MDNENNEKNQNKDEDKNNQDQLMIIEDPDNQQIPQKQDLIEVSENKKQELIEEAKKYQELFKQFQAEFDQPNILMYYIISKNWLDSWKKYVSYQEICEGKDPNIQFFGQLKPEKVNKDILEGFTKDQNLTQQYLPVDNEFDYSAIVLKPDLQEEVQYVVISKEISDFFQDNYGGIIIPRPACQLQNGQKRVEVYLKHIKCLVINLNILKKADHKNITGFKTFIYQCFTQSTTSDFKQRLVPVLNSFLKSNSDYNSNSNSGYYSYYPNISSDILRLWKLDPEVSLDQAFQYIHEICNRTNSYNYRIDMKGQYLEKDNTLKIEDLCFNANDVMVIEIREQNQNWFFVHDSVIPPGGVDTFGKCEYCNKYTNLSFPCICKQVSYCSEECKIKDQRFHIQKCDKAGESGEEDDNPLEFNSQSVKGICGLSNLGNTCFMNSALQCLSNTFPLTKYFLDKKYKKEINVNNPLGTKGKLVKKYASLLKNLWIGNQNMFSPYAIKSAVAQFQPMFSGYNQHDSQEFISYILDGIHEDLNRVKVKKYLETIENQGRPDEEIARLSWLMHCQRNQSIIIDLMQGQYKSKLTCPECNNISITFDPFLSCTLQIPTKKIKYFDFFFISRDNRIKPLLITYKFPSLEKQTIQTLKQWVSQKFQIDIKCLDFAFLSNQGERERCTQDQLLSEIKKKIKMWKLFCLEESAEDQQIPADDKKRVIVNFNNYSSFNNMYNYYQQKRPFTLVRPFYFKKSMTTKQIHHKFFSYFKFLWETQSEKTEECDRIKNLSLEEAYDEIMHPNDKKNEPYHVLIVTNQRLYNSCFFCQQSNCTNCDLPYDESITFQDILDKIKKDDFEFQFDIYFENPPSFIDPCVLNSYEKYKDTDQQQQDNNYNNNKITIYDCLRASSQPEQLGADNTWYCNKCKKHQQAYKEMSIYRAPEILIMHLKRFRQKSAFTKAKITDVIQYPIDGDDCLDMTDFVKEKETPDFYFRDGKSDDILIKPLYEQQQQQQQQQQPQTNNINTQQINTVPLDQNINNSQSNQGNFDIENPVSQPSPATVNTTMENEKEIEENKAAGIQQDLVQKQIVDIDIIQFEEDSKDEDIENDNNNNNNNNNQNNLGSNNAGVDSNKNNNNTNERNSTDNNSNNNSQLQSSQGQQQQNNPQQQQQQQNYQGQQVAATVQQNQEMQEEVKQQQNLNSAIAMVDESNTDKQQSSDNQNKNSNDRLLYELYAVSNHYGGLGGGHYTAYVKNNFTKQWYQCDDSHVSQMTRGNVVGAESYILFYQRKNKQ